MRYKKSIFTVLLSILLTQSSCKKFAKSQNIKNSNKKDSISFVKGTSKKEQLTSIYTLEKFSGRKELDIYKGNNNIIWGEFYSPKTDSLLIFKFVPKNQKAQELIKYMETLPISNHYERQIVILTNLNAFDITLKEVNYSCVIEQEDTGGFPVFNVKKPFEAKIFIQKGNNMLNKGVKTYQKFQDIYK